MAQRDAFLFLPLGAPCAPHHAETGFLNGKGRMIDGAWLSIDEICPLLINMGKPLTPDFGFEP